MIGVEYNLLEHKSIVFYEVDSPTAAGDPGG